MGGSSLGVILGIRVKIKLELIFSLGKHSIIYYYKLLFIIIIVLLFSGKHSIQNSNIMEIWYIQFVQSSELVKVKSSTADSLTTSTFEKQISQPSGLGLF